MDFNQALACVMQVCFGLGAALVLTAKLLGKKGEKV